MEILSTGEKIKKQRTYKGITLKELCGDNISISKMSCIENGKVKADDKILKFIAEKLDVDFEYLICDVYDQIVIDINNIKNSYKKGIKIEKNIKNDIRSAMEHEYFNLGFELMHILFNYYIDNNMNEQIQIAISDYSDIYQKFNNKSNTRSNTIIYFKDMARYLFENKEYYEALVYYGRVREIIEMFWEQKDSLEYLQIKYQEAICYSRINDVEKAFELMNEIIENKDKIKELVDLAEIFQEYAIICIRKKSDMAETYIKKVSDLKKDKPLEIAKARCQYGAFFFEVSQEKKAINEILEGARIFPKDDKKEYGNYLKDCIEILLKNKIYSEAFRLTEEALNVSIVSDDIRLIERIYYYKGTILQRQGKYQEAERFMNLSLDSLFKFGTKEERYKRYIDMGTLYYNLKDIKESIKYFTLATRIKNIL